MAPVYENAAAQGKMFRIESALGLIVRYNPAIELGGSSHLEVFHRECEITGAANFTTPHLEIAMSTELLSLIGSQLGGDTLQTLSRSIDATPEQTQSAISAAVPALIAALARNTAQPDGQQQLHHALSNDHDGSILDSLGSLFGSGETASPTPGVSDRTTAGGAILDHILGDRKSRVEEGVSRASGLSTAQVMKLLMMLAPMLMGALGKRRQQEDLSPGGLGDLLQGESASVEAASGGGGLVGRMLDQDGDGDFDMMDMMKFGAGKLFGGQ